MCWFLWGQKESSVGAEDFSRVRFKKKWEGYSKFVRGYLKRWSDECKGRDWEELRR